MDVQALEKKFREYLSRNHLFCTQERLVILRMIVAQEGHFSVDELLDYVRSNGLKVSRATLYRTLNHLSKAGILSEADFGHGHIHYEINEDGEHGHLICSDCGRVLEVSSSQFEDALRQLSQQQGFQLQSVKVEIFGLCSTCR